MPQLAGRTTRGKTRKPRGRTGASCMTPTLGGDLVPARSSDFSRFAPGSAGPCACQLFGDRVPTVQSVLRHCPPSTQCRSCAATEQPSTRANACLSINELREPDPRPWRSRQHAWDYRRTGVVVKSPTSESDSRHLAQSPELRVSACTAGRDPPSGVRAPLASQARRTHSSSWCARYRSRSPAAART